MKLRALSEIELQSKRVVVRMDLDVDNDFSRIEMSTTTLKYLLDKKAKIIIIGHKGRPKGVKDEKLSLRRLAPEISKLVGVEVKFIDEIVGPKVVEEIDKLGEGQILLLENLRFDPREEQNDEGFTRELAALADVYVNEAFAVVHREHASIVGIPKLLPHAAGLRLEKEVEYLSRVLENPKRPVVAVISGVKEDKMQRIEEFQHKADKILVGGRLPLYYDGVSPNPDKIIIGRLIADTEDITLHTIETFKDEIAKAGTIVLAGVPGKYEDDGHRQGTKEVFGAIAASSAFKVAGGGDAEAAITLLGLNDKFDWISVGGGAMLEYLSKGTLPGLEALLA